MAALSYKGYLIVLTNHPLPFKRDNLAYDIMNGDMVVKRNFSTSALCKFYIDSLISRTTLLDLSSRKIKENA